MFELGLFVFLFPHTYTNEQHTPTTQYYSLVWMDGWMDRLRQPKKQYPTATALGFSAFFHIFAVNLLLPLIETMYWISVRKKCCFCFGAVCCCRFWTFIYRVKMHLISLYSCIYCTCTCVDYKLHRDDILYMINSLSFVISIMVVWVRFVQVKVAQYSQYVSNLEKGQYWKAKLVIVRDTKRR